MSRSPEPIEFDGAKAVIYRDAPSWDGRRTAAVGNIDFLSAESGTALLKQIVEQLKQEDFGAVLGPMDGDTWHSYRVVVESDGSPPFLMEPTSGPNDLDAFKALAFEPVSQYISTRAPLEETLGAGPVERPGITSPHGMARMSSSWWTSFFICRHRRSPTMLFTNQSMPRLSLSSINQSCRRSIQGMCCLPIRTTAIWLAFSSGSLIVWKAPNLRRPF